MPVQCESVRYHLNPVNLSVNPIPSHPIIPSATNSNDCLRSSPIVHGNGLNCPIHHAQACIQCFCCRCSSHRKVNGHTQRIHHCNECLSNHPTSGSTVAAECLRSQTLGEDRCLSRHWQQGHPPSATTYVPALSQTPRRDGHRIANSCLQRQSREPVCAHMSTLIADHPSIDLPFPP